MPSELAVLEGEIFRRGESSLEYALSGFSGLSASVLSLFLPDLTWWCRHVVTLLVVGGCRLCKFIFRSSLLYSVIYETTSRLS